VALQPLSLSATAAAWLESLTYETLPPDIAALTRLRVLDVIGNIIAASRRPIAHILRHAFATLSPGPVRVPGLDIRLSPPAAALVSGSLGSALDFDDTHTATILHFSTPTVAAGLAAARETSGRELIAAVAGGGELMCRLGMLTPGEFHKHGFHATAVLGSVGAAYTSARLLRLPAEGIANAAAIAAGQAAGLTQSIAEETSSRLLFAGWAAQLGLTAAQLARSGMRGPDKIFEGERGLFRTHIGRALPPDATISTNLGTAWETRNAAFKLFPCGHVLHPFIAAALALVQAEHIRSDEIATVECRVPPYAVAMVCEPAEQKQAPADDVGARISLQHTVAETLCLGRLDGLSYSNDALSNPAIRSLARRVSYVADEAFATRERFVGELIVTMKDGRKHSRKEPSEGGEGGRPIEPDDIERKFRSNVAGAQLSAEPAAIHRLVAGLEGLDNLDSLTRLCCPP